MKKMLELLTAFSMFVVSLPSLYAQEVPEVKLYLEQTPPGNIPQIFNLPVTAGLRPAERIAITSDGREIYYSELDRYPPVIQRIKYFKYSDNKWQGPFTVFEGFRVPWLSANDSIIYMQKHVGQIVCSFYSKRTKTGWSTPVRLLSKNQQTHYFQTSKLNNSYVSSIAPGTASDKDICRFLTVNSDTLIQSLGAPINTKNNETDFFISADESYMLLIRANNTTASDIFISYKNDKGRWTNPKLIGEPISKPSPSWEYGQYVTRDNKYLFFTRGGLSMDSYNIYWVRIDNVIDSLRHTNFTPYLANQLPDLSIQSGQKFNYALLESTFIDDDGNNTLAYSVTLFDGSQLPAWLSFDPVKHVFTGIPAGTGSIKIKITAADTANESASCIFNIKVME